MKNIERYAEFAIILPKIDSNKRSDFSFLSCQFHRHKMRANKPWLELNYFYIKIFENIDSANIKRSLLDTCIQIYSKYFIIFWDIMRGSHTNNKKQTQNYW